MDTLVPDCITESLKTLLESKHLYQSLDVETDHAEKAVDESAKKMGFPQMAKGLWSDYRSQLYGFWYPKNELHPMPEMASKVRLVPFGVPDLKLFCPTCNRKEAHNPTVSTAALASYSEARPQQVFAFSYQCQSCKQFPQTFLVRRDGKKLTLCGRSPIEFVEIPQYVPNKIRVSLKNAIVAHQSGQTLAGNFLLRTLIEQWVRIATGSDATKKADDVLSAYMEKLPSDFKQRFPSLPEIYSGLSADIHAAKGSESMFNEAHIKICEHFDALRIFKIKFDNQ